MISWWRLFIIVLVLGGIPLLGVLFAYSDLSDLEEVKRVRSDSGEFELVVYAQCMYANIDPSWEVVLESSDGSAKEEIWPCTEGDWPKVRFAHETKVEILLPGSERRCVTNFDPETLKPADECPTAR